MRINKKGFTLMELLATVVILGIISTIGIVAVNKVLEKSHKEYDIKQAKMVTTAAQSYFTDNKSKLPQIPLTTEFVRLSELINNNYIGDVVDYKKEKYDTYKSITTVRKMAANRYIYYTKLVRKDGSLAYDENPENIVTSNIEIMMSPFDLTETSTKDKIDGMYHVNGKISTNVNIKSTNNEKIAAYRYQILKVNSNEKVYKKSEYIKIDNTQYEDVITLDKDNLMDGKYKLKVTAYDYKGWSVSAVSDIVVIDGTKPKCELKINDKPTGDNGWYTTEKVYIHLNKKDNMSVTSYDVNNTGYKSLAADSFAYEFTEGETTAAGKNLNFSVKDKAGNVSSCNINVKKDSVVPECKNVEKIGSYNGDVGVYTSPVTLKFDCVEKNNCYFSITGEDKDMKLLENKKYNEVFDETMYLTNNKLRDDAGNSRICEMGKAFMFDLEPPQCTLNNHDSINDQWFNNNVTLNYTMKDDKCVYHPDIGSCKKEFEYNKLYTEEGYYSSYTVANDFVGNSVVCRPSVFIRIDRTPPSCYINDVYDPSAKTLRFETQCIDSLSGCFKTDSAQSVVTIKDNNNNISSYSTDIGLDNLYNTSIKEYTITSTVYDHAHNTGTCSVTKYIGSLSCPSISVDGELGYNNWYTSYPTISFNFNGTNATKYKMSYNGYEYATSKNVYTFRDEGIYDNIYITVYDKNNNSRNCSLGTIKVDTVPPVITTKSESNEYGDYVQVVECKDNQSDNGRNSGVSKFGVDLEDNNVFILDESINKYGRFYETTDITDGKRIKFTYLSNGYKYTMAQCEDRAGNFAKNSNANGLKSLFGSDGLACSVKDAKTGTTIFGPNYGENKVVCHKQTPPGKVYNSGCEGMSYKNNNCHELKLECK